jgi:tRNA-specific 2-thiouridylase
LKRGLDESKDQSYVLFGAAGDTLDRMMLPIGGMHKAEVRDRAKAYGLPVFDKPDSQEICFVPDNDYAGFVERQQPELRVRGRIVNLEGNEIGQHDGHHRFTIGQRRGVGIAQGTPIYVVEKDHRTNTIVVGSRDDLMFDSCIGGEAQWLTEPPTDWTRCRAQHRYNSAACRAEYRAIDAGETSTPSGRRGRFEVRFDEPQFAVAPGQAIVLYDQEQDCEVLGGGWIERASREGTT